MSDPDPTLQQPHQPTTGAPDTDQPGERLDRDKVPAEFPDRPVAAFEHGTTEREMEEGESLDDRLSRELPDVDEQAEPLDSTTPTPLQDDAGIDGQDEEKDLVADVSPAEPHIDDSGHPDVPASAEEAAVRVEDVDAVPGATEHAPDKADG